MESIGKVMSLKKQVVNGYKTFNSVAVNMNKQGVHLLPHTLYSTGSDNYVTQKSLANLEEACPEIQAIVAKNEHVNTSTILQSE